MNSSSEAAMVITASKEQCSDDDNYNKLQQNITVTLDNVHRCTTFTLRQELEKRNVTFESSGIVNHNILLQKMIQILYNDDEQRTREEEDNVMNDISTINSSLDSETIQDRLYRQKMERKKEAMERSRQRQLNKEYFRNIKIANERGRMEESKHGSNHYKNNLRNESNCRSISSIYNVDESGAPVAVAVTVEESTCNNNPFATRFQSKIGGRFI